MSAEATRAAGSAGIARIVAGTLISGMAPKCMAISGKVASVVITEMITEATSSVIAYWAHLAGAASDDANGAVSSADTTVIVAETGLHRPWQ